MRKKIAASLSMAVLFVTAMATNVFAADAYDMAGAITTTVGELTTQFSSLVAIIVPAVLTIVGGKLVITKGIGWFKSLTGKAS